MCELVGVISGACVLSRGHNPDDWGSERSNAF